MSELQMLSRRAYVENTSPKKRQAQARKAARARWRNARLRMKEAANAAPSAQP